MSGRPNHYSRECVRSGLIFCYKVETVTLPQCKKTWKRLQMPRKKHTTVVSKLTTDRHFICEELISNYRYRIALPEELISITETDLWEFQQKISHYRYRFSLEIQLISITDTDFGLKAN